MIEYAERFLPKSRGTMGRTPQSNHLYEALRQNFNFLFQKEGQYQEAFDKFEYFFGLVHYDLKQKTGMSAWAPESRYIYGYDVGLETDLSVRSAHPILNDLEEQIKRHQEQLPLLKAGFFNGDSNRLREIKDRWDLEVIKRANKRHY